MKIILNIIIIIISHSMNAFSQDLIKVGTDVVFNINGAGNTSLGIKSGEAISSGVNNTFLGYLSGYNNTTGTSNSFVGRRAGYSNISGNSNSFFGYDAGLHVNGSSNTIIGALAGTASLTNPNMGNSNTFVGVLSGNLNTTGTLNTFIGSQSGEKNTIGQYNTFVGHASGNANSTGNNNTNLGLYAGLKNTIGSTNTFLGRSAGETNTTGSGNLFVGFSSGVSNTFGNDNTGLGTEAGKANTIGQFNTFIGHTAGTLNTTGSYNIFIGALSNSFGLNATSLERSVAIGYNAKVSINDALVLGDWENSNIKVGIGIHNPQYKLDVKGVVNMRIGYNSPAMKINDKDFIALDNNGTFILPNFKLKYVNQNQWSDYVFQNNYNLMPIEEVIKFTIRNKHLPNIPNAQEVEKNGLDINDILSKMLAKIEELTLYVNQINEESKKLKSEIIELKTKK